MPSPALRGAAVGGRKLVFALAVHRKRLFEKKGIQRSHAEGLRQLFPEAVVGEAQHGDLDGVAAGHVQKYPVIDRAEIQNVRVIDKGSPEGEPFLVD